MKQEWKRPEKARAYVKPKPVPPEALVFPALLPEPKPEVKPPVPTKSIPPPARGWKPTSGDEIEAMLNDLEGDE